MNKRLVYALLLLAACPLYALSQSALAATPGAVTLRYNFTPGQVHRYKIIMDMNTAMQPTPSAQGVPINSHTEMIMRQTTQDVRSSDGAATLTSEIESLSTSVNGSPLQLPAAEEARMKKPSTTMMTPTGKVLSFQIGGLPPGGIPGMDFSKGFMSGNYTLPENPVQVGESWNGSAASGMVGMQMAIRSTLQKLDISAGTPGIAKIAQNLSGTFHNDLGRTSAIPMKMTGEITGTGTQHFDVGAGAIAGGDMTMQAVMKMVIGNAGSQMPSGVPHAMQMKMQMHLTMDRLPDTPVAPIR